MTQIVKISTDEIISNLCHLRSIWINNFINF
jgi:hypothetical protein